MPRFLLPLASLLVVAFACPLPTVADEEGAVPPPLATAAWIDAPVAEVWEAFTTADGWKKFGIPRVAVDFRVGGAIRTSYDPKSTLDDASTIENTILAYEPQRMLSLRATKAPANFPFPPELLARTWSVFTFDDLGDGRTRVVARGYGYGEDDASKKMRAFFEQGNAWSMQQLAARLGRKRPAAEAALRPIELTAVVAADPSTVFEAWTTEAGLRRFLGVESRVRLEVGGPYELFFDASAAEGQRGSEGCVVQTWVPDRLLAFSWNAPPSFAPAREGRTRVVIELEREDQHHTRVWLTHAGFEGAARAIPDGEWPKVRAYFANAWPRVLEALENHFEERWD